MTRSVHNDSQRIDSHANSCMFNRGWGGGGFSVQCNSDNVITLACFGGWYGGVMTRALFIIFVTMANCTLRVYLRIYDTYIHQIKNHLSRDIE